MFLITDISGCCGSSALIWMMWAFMECQNHYSNVHKHWRQPTPLHKPRTSFCVWHNHCSLREPTQIRTSQELSRHDRLASITPWQASSEKRLNIFARQHKTWKTKDGSLSKIPARSFVWRIWVMFAYTMFHMNFMLRAVKREATTVKRKNNISFFPPCHWCFDQSRDFSECNMSNKYVLSTLTALKYLS